MSARSLAVLAVLLLAVSPAGAEKTHKLVDIALNAHFERRPFHKIVVVAIVEDAETRRRFEDKFVSHLRGRDVEATVSYGIAPDLLAPPSRALVSEFVADESIDGAISVRVVPLKGRTEEEWADAWREFADGSSSLTDLVAESLPVTVTKSKTYGVEVTLWDADKRIHVWSARTNPYTLKEMRKGAGDFVQFVIDALKRDRLL